MTLTDVWFTLIALLWTGYFFLEGFDFGVGILLPVLGRSETHRRLLINTIGPVWDGNEVWLIVAAGATFAAFPEWYASLFSGFYLPLLVILVALILRGVAFEYRGKVDSDRWRRNWDRAIVFGSLAPAVLWGAIFASVVHGVALDADHQYAGGPLDLLSPYALAGGAATLLLFTTHGAVFVALKTTGDIRHSARAVAGRTGVAALVAVAGCLAWLQLTRGTTATAVTAALGAAALLAALIAVRAGREGRAFGATAVTIVAATATLFGALHPDVLPSTLDPAYSLTITNAAASPYTLRIMTWVAVAFIPVVLLYQGWTYWVFRKRIGAQQIPPVTSRPSPAGAARS
ncbi:cytochrome d ubiquinol oxidase subunit II [Planosporangium thailandense]|uniref:Cytochrome d ubiquinol oxidase subunit II n=1 Tax=Planosporangium thailandense TaxID=765197 RepID=A0ABX0XY08_9ACTN|nr:cytochrome d ubiquinol oxidase subunit II [Planosporangium thailandense]NJC70807.1 cytochrome d ubiquinol oxidase subunit II [Planosporangium thailandense]